MTADFHKAAFQYPKVLNFEFQFTRNQYTIFMEEWVGLPPVPKGEIRWRKNHSPGCDLTCPATRGVGAACECGAQEFYYRVHQWHGQFEPYIDTPCPCFPCRSKK